MGGRKRPAPPVIVSAIGTARGVSKASAVGTITDLPLGSRIELRLVRGRGRPKDAKARARRERALLAQIAADTGETVRVNWQGGRSIPVPCRSMVRTAKA